MVDTAEPIALPPTRLSYSPARLAPVLDAIKRGISPTRAAILAGIPKQTLSSWRNERPDVALAVEQAEAVHISDAADRLRACTTKWGSPDPKALELELRRYPEYRQHQETTVTSLALTATVHLTADQAAQLAARHQAALEGE